VKEYKLKNPTLTLDKIIELMIADKIIIRSEAKKIKEGK
jgi:hypothetical protein